VLALFTPHSVGSEIRLFSEQISDSRKEAGIGMPLDKAQPLINLLDKASVHTALKKALGVQSIRWELTAKVKTKDGIIRFHYDGHFVLVKDPESIEKYDLTCCTLRNFVEQNCSH
jgi:hypothetical protein